jgi:hypothetical protein
VGRGRHAAGVLHLAGISEHASGHARGRQAALLRAADAVVGGRHVVGHFGADAELGKGDCKQTDR